MTLVVIKAASRAWKSCSDIPQHVSPGMIRLTHQVSFHLEDTSNASFTSAWDEKRLVHPSFTPLRT
jgi:hypothetical protein